MTPIADMVKRLFEKGVDLDAILIAIEAAERTMLSTGMSGGIPVDKTLEKRRAYDRERKRRVRGIPPDSTGIPPEFQNAPLSLTTTTNLSLDRERERKGSVHRTRGHRLPDDWYPSQTDWEDAVCALGDERAGGEFMKFRDHWKQQPGSKGVKADWNATWRNWYRRAAEYGAKNAKPESKIIQAADSLRRKIASFDGPVSDDLGLRDGPGAAAAGLLQDR